MREIIEVVKVQCLLLRYRSLRLIEGYHVSRTLLPDPNLDPSDTGFRGYQLLVTRRGKRDYLMTHASDSSYGRTLTLER